MPDRRISSAFVTAAVSAALLAGALPALALPAAAPPPAAAADGAVQAPVQHTLDAVDPTAGNNPGGTDPASGACFPGCRGTDQLLAYTPAYGQESTGTNAYGTEVVVRDGRITKIGGNDSAIPADGLVLSGHGTGAKWLTTHAVVGAKVELSGRQVTLTVDAEAHVVAAELARDEARGRLAGARGSCTVFPEEQVEKGIEDAERLIGDARTALADGREPDAVALAGQATTAATGAADRTRESRGVEGRGVWVRPTETTPAEIRATLDRIEHAGFNMVFLETVWQGYTIFPSDAARAAGITDQRPSMKGFDPLQVWIEEAHRRGIELHAWVHTFFVGSDSAEGPGPVLSAHPEWAAVEREDVGADEPRPSRMEPGYYFVDPAMPEPRAYITSVFEELLTDYAVDGVHLDYIRYPVSLPYDASFSYSDYSRTAFEEEHDVDPYTLKEGDPAWETWNSWREGNITTFVQGVREMQQRVRPDAPLSAAVFADPVDGLKKKFQNWGAWVDAGYLDFLTGMSFGTSPGSVAADTKVMRERVGDVNLYTATYGPFHSSPSSVIGDQLQAVKDADSDGTALFAYNQLTDQQVEALHTGAYRTPARAPHSDPADATRQGLGELRKRLGAATATCIRQGEAAPVQARLTAAEELLQHAGDRGVAPAARLLADAVSEVGRWSSEADAVFTATVVRDLRMYQRWLRQTD
ncbi:glycoside hydrolase family 10 protein [Streptomyces sp. MAR4 CNY-716]